MRGTVDSGMTVDVHRCRFVDYDPHTITSLEFSHRSTKKFSPGDLRLAVGRNNGDVEIWNPKSRWIHEFTLYGGKDRTVEGLVWSTPENDEPRLFSIGNSTMITEWDLKTGLVLRQYDCNSSDIWSITINENQDKLAVGCDDGTVVLVDISGGVGSLEHHGFLQRQDARVLSLAWKGNDLIIGGCSDGRIRVWNTKEESFGPAKFSLISTMRVDKSKIESTLVWSVLYLPQQRQIVSGDSTGSVKFWDLDHFTLLQSFKVHEADILTLATDLENENLYSAGVDRKIFNFKIVENGANKQKKWTNISSRLFHSNDIRSMCCYESKNYNFLVSGGVEKNIVISSIKTFIDGQYHKLSFIPQQKHVVLNKRNKIIILWQDQTVKIWKLLKDEDSISVAHDSVSENYLGNSFELISKLTLSDDDNISTVNISPDGSLLAVGRLTGTKLFQLKPKPNSNKLTVKKLKNEELNDTGSRDLVFNGNDSLLVVSTNNEILKFDSIDSDDESDPYTEYKLAPNIRHKSKLGHIECINNIKLTQNNKKLVISKICGAIDIIDLDDEEAIDVKPFLRLSSFINKLEVSPRETLIVLTVDNKLYEFDVPSSSSSSTLSLSSNHLTYWSKVNSEFLPKRFLRLKDSPIGMFSDSSDSYKVWVYGCDWLSFFKLDVNIPIKQLKKDRKRVRSEAQIGVNEDIEIDIEDSEVEEEFDEVQLIEDRELLLKNNSSEFISSGVPFWITDKYRTILFADSFSEGNEILVIERPQFALEQQPAFKLQKIRV